MCGCCYVRLVNMSVETQAFAKPSISKERLHEEYKAWEVNHPEGFRAKPITKNGTTDYLVWECDIPGRPKTLWADGVYHLRMEFSDSYPYQPPQFVSPPLGFFSPPLFHPNVYPSGRVALSLLDKDWKPQITVKQVLLGIQLLLDDPNFNEPAQAEAYVVHSQGKHLYDAKVREQAHKMAAVS